MKEQKKRGNLYNMHKSEMLFQKKCQIDQIMPKSYPHQIWRKIRKKRVIHGVIHIIHIFGVKNIGLHSKKIECVFCVEMIKLTTLRKKWGKLQTFQIFKNRKKRNKISVNSEKTMKPRLQTGQRKILFGLNEKRTPLCDKVFKACNQIHTKEGVLYD